VAPQKPGARRKARNPRNSSSPPPPEGANPRRHAAPCPGLSGEGRGEGALGTQTRNADSGALTRNWRAERTNSDPSPQADFRQNAKHGFPDPAALLSWFDRHRRVLPWRAAPGESADPYRVWVSEVMLQQTTVKAVTPYYLRFVAAFPSVAALAQADIEDVLKLWAGLGYYARARHLHACAKVIDRGAFPDREEELRRLPGIGPYTAAAIAAIAFERKASPVDGNVERVIARLFAVEEQLPNAKPAIRKLAADLYPARRVGDFAQAMMDLGATVCTPKAPICGECPIAGSCAARARGDAQSYPRKTKKPESRLRRGAAFVAIRADGHLLVRRRAAKGLLGGMTEVPTTEWRADFVAAHALANAPRFPPPRRRRHEAVMHASPQVRWHRVPGVVNHVFTHFSLELVVLRARVPKSAVAPEGMHWIDRDSVAGAALPSVMRKVVAHALGRPDRPPLSAL
jgi:A/G-specific adenine glycosylase